MDLGIGNKVALVAASSRGLGLEAARALAQEGARLMLCSRNPNQLKQAALEVKNETGAKVETHEVDLTREEQVQQLVKETIQHFGGLDILVTNCGGPPSGSFLEHSTQRWREAVDLNLMSSVYLCRQAIPPMLKKKWGRIVLMTSVSVKQPLDGLILSNSVRAAVVGLSKSLANELGGTGICVNAVCPGFFLTDRVRALAEDVARNSGKTSEEVLARFASQSVQGRVAEPAEFGPLVAFLCSRKASYLTGTAIAIDGGLSRGLL